MAAQNCTRKEYRCKIVKYIKLKGGRNLGKIWQNIRKRHDVMEDSGEPSERPKLDRNLPPVK